MLLREFTPARVVVLDPSSPQQALRELGEVAKEPGDRLVVVDSTLRAESNALANLLDDPRVSSGVLLANNAADVDNATVRIDDRHLIPAPSTGSTHDAQPTIERATAGILVIDSADCTAFEEALCDALPGVTDASDPWTEAVQALTNCRPVRGVEAAPFCASREAMELPRRSEDDRRLRASGSPGDDIVIRDVVRPATRRMTKWSVSRQWRPDRISLLGLGAGLLATAAAIPGLLIGNIAAAVALVVSGAAFLSSMELVRYRRRPSLATYRRYALRRRIVDVAFLLGLSAGVGSTWGWIVGGIGLAVVAVGTSLASSRLVSGTTEARTAWPIRWIVTAIALVVAGPVGGLVTAAMVALLDIGLQVLTMLRHPQQIIQPVPAQQRFLVPPGALLDAGIAVRLLSARKIGGWEVRSGLLATAAVALTVLGGALAWGHNPWLLAVLLIAGVILLGQALRLPAQGSWAAALPAVTRGLESVVVRAVASNLPGVGPAAAAGLVAAALLLTSDVADRWRLLRSAGAPWQPLADLGFDGRALILTVAAMFSAAVGAWVASVLVLLVTAIWLVSALSLNREVSRIGSPSSQ